MTYSDETTEVTITRSVVSGVFVLRHKPESDRGAWRLVKPNGQGTIELEIVQ
jgi:hypothetical protein